MPREHAAHTAEIMNYRKRRANAWAGLFVGFVGTDDESNEQASDNRVESRRSEDGD